MQKSMSSQLWFVSPWLRPMRRCVFVSVAVTSIYPSPEAIVCVDTAPAFQPSDEFFVKLLPEAVTPTTFVQTTLCALLTNVTFVSIDPLVRSQGSSSNRNAPPATLV